MEFNFKKNILHLCSYYIGNKLYKHLFSELCQTFKQRVYVPIKNSSLIGVNEIYNNEIEFVYDDFLKPYHKFFYGSKINSQLYRLDRYFNNEISNDIDLVHAHTLFSDGGTAYLLFKKYNIPYVVTVRNTDVNLFYKYAIHYRSFSHEILRNASKIIFVSHAYKKLFCSVLPSNVVEKISHNFLIIPNGISMDFIDKPLKKRKCEGINLFTSASLDKNKNIKSVIDLVIQLKEEFEDVNYKVAGKGSLLMDLKRYVEKRGVSSNVEFLGHLSHDELIEQLDVSDIFIMLSYKETFGISYIEAIARGVPIIYTKNQGVDGFFSQGEVGYSTRPKDLSSMKLAVNNIMRDYSNISQRCRQEAIDFSWDSISRKYVKTYNDVINN